MYIICFNTLYAQGGGPPMLTDDPGTVDFHKWEINTSVNSTITNNTQLAIPYIDANYGVANNLQLKAEGGYLFTFNDHRQTSGALTNVLLGIKYRFINQENKHFLSASLYPQLTVNGTLQGLLLPLLVEKTMGKFMLGEEIGYFTGKNNSDALINGNLLGYIFSDKFQIMGEYFVQKNYTPVAAAAGFMNYGFRYTINNAFTILGSFGTQVLNSGDQQRQYFISYLGLQSSF